MRKPCGARVSSRRQACSSKPGLLAQFHTNNHVSVSGLQAGRTLRVGGWVKTGREAGGGAWVFLELNDGSCFENLQVTFRFSHRVKARINVHTADKKALHCLIQLPIERKAMGAPSVRQYASWVLADHGDHRSR